MKKVEVCAVCGSINVIYEAPGKCFCGDCGKTQPTKTEIILSSYDRARNAAYATGNRWAIENFNRTH